jgi:hypothetical protein
VAASPPVKTKATVRLQQRGSMEKRCKYVIYLVTCEEMSTGGSDDTHLIQALTARGHEVHTKVWTESSVQWSEADAVILRTTWDYHRRLPEFLTWAKAVESETLLLNPLSVIEWNYSKRYLLDIATKANEGVQIIPTILTTDLEEVISSIQTLASDGKVKGTVIVKPSISGSAELTYRIPYDEDQEKIKSITNTILSQNKGLNEVMIQSFVSSIIEDGEVSLMFLRQENVQQHEESYQFTHAVLKTVQTGDFRVQSDYGGQVKLLFDQSCIEGYETLLDLARRALHAFDQTLSQTNQDHQDQNSKVFASSWLYGRVDVVDWKSASPKIGEIEVIEPEMFFRFSQGNEAANKFLSCVEDRINRFREASR